MAEKSIPHQSRDRAPPHKKQQTTTREDRTFVEQTVYHSKEIVADSSTHTVVMCRDLLLGVVYVRYSDAGVIPEGTAVDDANYYAPAVVSKVSGFWTKIEVRVNNSPFSYDLLNPPTRNDYRTKGPLVVKYKNESVPLEKIIAEINRGQAAEIKMMAEGFAAQQVSAESAKAAGKSSDENADAISDAEDDEDDDDDAEEGHTKD